MIDWNMDYLIRPICISLIFFVAFYLQSKVRKEVLKLGEKHKIPSNLSIVIRVISRWLLILIATIASLAVLGIQFGNIWTLLSTVLAMLAVGFIAVWSILSNILSFFVLLIWHHWKLGDRIAVLPENIEGVVEDMDMIFTTLRTTDGNLLTIPNNMLLQRIVRVIETPI